MLFCNNKKRVATPQKIAVTGPESTGKSWLARSLAAHFNTVFVPEFARAYIDRLERPYREDDLLEIAKGQLSAQEDALKNAADLMVCDTELIVIKVWSLHKYGKCHSFILEQIEKQDYDLFLLCDIDLPWEFDQQREHPHLRQYFFNWYQKELETYGFPFAIVSGEGEDRLMSAVNAIEKLRRYENEK